MAWSDDFSYFPKSKRIAVDGGIKAHSKKGAFASSWWGKRWIAVLDALNLGGRLQRGRTYARKGQVIGLEIATGVITAQVQGSRPKPYAVKIKVTALAPGKLAGVSEELKGNAYCIAKLMAREMPQDIETIFSGAGAALFPERVSELHTECSCPDWSNPCKHIAAVYYLLGEEFDRDPFLIFRMRGIELGTLVGPVESIPEEVMALDEDPIENFWEGTRPDVDLLMPEQVHPAAPLLRRLGSLPFWRGELPLVEVLEPQYAAAQARIRERLSPEEPDAVTKTERHPGRPRRRKQTR